MKYFVIQHFKPWCCGSLLHIKRKTSATIILILRCAADFCGPSQYNVSTNKQLILQSEPGNGYNYADNLDCLWYLTATDAGNILIVFDFARIQTNRDYLSIGYGHNVTSETQVLLLSGSRPPKTFAIDQDTAWMWFTSDYRTAWRGFKVRITATKHLGELMESESYKSFTCFYLPVFQFICYSLIIIIMAFFSHVISLLVIELKENVYN